MTTAQNIANYTLAVEILFLARDFRYDPKRDFIPDTRTYSYAAVYCSNVFRTHRERFTLETVAVRADSFVCIVSRRVHSTGAWKNAIN